jgi:hypothetical protein
VVSNRRVADRSRPCRAHGPIWYDRAAARRDLMIASVARRDLAFKHSVIRDMAAFIDPSLDRVAVGSHHTGVSLRNFIRLSDHRNQDLPRGRRQPWGRNCISDRCSRDGFMKCTIQDRNVRSTPHREQ